MIFTSSNELKAMFPGPQGTAAMCTRGNAVVVGTCDGVFLAALSAGLVRRASADGDYGSPNWTLGSAMRDVAGRTAVFLKRMHANSC